MLIPLLLLFVSCSYLCSHLGTDSFLKLRRQTEFCSKIHLLLLQPFRTSIFLLIFCLLALLITDSCVEVSIYNFVFIHFISVLSILFLCILKLCCHCIFRILLYEITSLCLLIFLFSEIFLVRLTQPL